MTALVEGQLFSLNYLLEPELLPDSDRMRRRLFAFMHSMVGGITLRNQMNDRLGTNLSNMNCANEGYWRTKCTSFELRDVLDTVTLCYDFVSVMKTSKSAEFLERVSSIFEETQVRYRVDAKGGVHLAVDVAFENARSSSVRVLTNARYKAVNASLTSAYVDLDKSPPDGKLAIRHIFDANEVLFRLMFPRAPSLNNNSIQQNLPSTIDRKYDANTVAKRAAHKQIVQFKSWVEGVHNYRHAQGEEELSQPPIELALHYVTAGTAWLRWLQSFDEEVNSR